MGGGGGGGGLNSDQVELHDICYITISTNISCFQGYCLHFLSDFWLSIFLSDYRSMAIWHLHLDGKMSKLKMCLCNTR